MEEQKIPTEAEVNEALTADDVETELTEEERKVAAKIIPKLAAKANAMAEANKAKELNTFITQLTEKNKVDMAAAIEKARKSLIPPTQEELQVLLDQDYMEFKLKIGKTKEEFTIGELTQWSEKRVLKTIKKVFAENLKDLIRIDWQGSQLERINQLLDVVPGAMDAMAECCAICLDPFEERKDVTAEWVLKNISLKRMVDILSVQIEANRYRDFFSNASHQSLFQMMG